MGFLLNVYLICLKAPYHSTGRMSEFQVLFKWPMLNGVNENKVLI